MTTTSLDPLIADLLEWLDREPRTMPEVLDVWRTSCPRLTVWEDTCDRGLVERPGNGKLAVTITPAGRRFLATTRAGLARPAAGSELQPASRPPDDDRHGDRA